MIDIRRADHRIDVAHRGLVLDFRHDLRRAPEHLHRAPQFLHIARLPRKAERKKIHLHLRAQPHIRQILLRQRRQIHAHARED